jgi:hypothetical protein
MRLMPMPATTNLREASEGGYVPVDCPISNSGNVGEVSALALGFVVSPHPIETDKYFPNLGCTVAACADAFGWYEICSPYACGQPFQFPATWLVALALFPISGV